VTGWYADNAWLPGGLTSGVRIDTTAGMIVGVGAGDPRPGDIRLPGLVLPGLANCHSHAFHRALRGRTHDHGGTFWTWRDRMYHLSERLDPDSYFALARAAFAEMVLAGYTVVGEFHYLHHDRGGARYGDPTAMADALISAAEQAGIRLTLLDTLYLAGGLNAETGHTPLNDNQARFADCDVAGWADRVAGLVAGRSGSTTRVGAAVHSVRAVPAPALAEVAAVRDDLGLSCVHAHISEQPAENAAATGFYDLTPTQLVERAGLLDHRFTAVHATHLSQADIAALARAGSYAGFCPTTERDLADGIGPAGDLAAAGVALCLGSDQHVVLDPFAEIAALEGHHRLVSLQRGRFSPEELVRIATVNGYRSLGWAEGGTVRVGAPADFIAVATDSIRTAGAAVDQVPLVAGACDVSDVVVAGSHVVSGGRHRLGDVAGLLAECIEPLWSTR
jgi:formiminoglutamate deiminase